MNRYFVVAKIYEHYELLKIEDIMDENNGKYMTQRVSSKEVDSKSMTKYQLKNEVTVDSDNDVQKGKVLLIEGIKYAIEDIITKKEVNKVMYSDDSTQEIGNTHNYIITDKTVTERVFVNSNKELVDFIFENTEQQKQKEYYVPEFEM